MPHIVTVNATENQIQSVCVFQSSRAEIKRSIHVDLKAGQNEVRIENLSNCLDSSSIRAEGVGHAVIFDVTYTPPAFNSYPSTGSKSEEIVAMTKRTEVLRWEEMLLQNQVYTLDDYSKALTPKDTDIAKLDEFLAVYRERTTSIYTDIDGIKDEREKLFELIDAKSKEQHEEGKGGGVKVSVNILVNTDGPIELLLWYVVWNVSWQPLYDVRATIGNSKEESRVALQYKASITQHTGEDWTDVLLSLSTGSGQRCSEIPKLKSQRIGLTQPPVITPGGRYPIVVRQPAQYIPEQMVLPGVQVIGQPIQPCVTGPPLVTQPSIPEDIQTPLPFIPRQVIHANAVVPEGAMNCIFHVPGWSTILTGGMAGPKIHNVSVAFMDMDAKMEWVAVPKMQASAFLRCHVKNTSEYTLLLGASSVFTDGEFVCKSWVPNVNPQETFALSLGVDPSLAITYHNLQTTAKNVSGGIFSAKINKTSCTQRITIKNNRWAGVYPLIIKDQIPVSDNAKIKVNLIEPKDLGIPKDKKEVRFTSGVKARWTLGGEEEANVAIDEEGCIEWVCEVGSGKSVDLAVSWEVSARRAKRWYSFL